MTARAAILAADGGNSKLDLALVGADGRIVGFRRSATISHQQVGLDEGMARLRELAAAMALESGIEGFPPVAGIGAFCLAGADFPAEVRTLQRALEGTGVAARTIVLNDTRAALRAGTSRGWGVAIICGQGVNGVAVAPDGRTAGFDALGDVSGDWGGGSSLGEAALAAAIRAVDGRGGPTELARLAPAHFGLKGPVALVRALYAGRVAHERLAELAPIVFEAAGGGDEVARGIVDRLADELVTMVRGLVRRTRLGHRAPEVVLAGGVFQTRDDDFYRRIGGGVQEAAPGARLVRLGLPPVIGAALIGLDALELPPGPAREAEARLRADGEHLAERLAAVPGTHDPVSRLSS